MRAKQVFISLTLLIIPWANAEQPGKPTHTQTATNSATQTSPDPIGDLFPGAQGSPQTASPPITPPKQPTYESWDVLRQYPRYEALPPPSVPEPKAPELEKETKEKPDVQ